MKYVAFNAAWGGSAKVKALARGAGTLLDLGGMQFRTARLLPSYRSNEPFAQDLATIGADFARAMQTSQQPQSRRK